MLNFDPKERPTASAVLNNAFFNQPVSAVRAEDSVPPSNQGNLSSLFNLNNSLPFHK